MREAALMVKTERNSMVVALNGQGKALYVYQSIVAVNEVDHDEAFPPMAPAGVSYTDFERQLKMNAQMFSDKKS
jgi:hypothetical protein